MRKYLPTSLLVLGYLVIVIGGVILFERTENNIQTNKENIARIEANEALEEYRERLQEREDCEAGNAARASIVDGLHGFRDALVAAAGQSEADDPQTPAERQRREQRTAAFIADLDRRLEPLKPVECPPAPPRPSPKTLSLAS